MDITLMEIALYIFAGTLAGTLGGLLGIGGGLLMVPMLTFIFTSNAFPYDEIPRLAVSTSHATILFISLSAVYTQYRKKMIDAKLFLVCLPAILVGTFVGGLTVVYAPAILLKIVFCIAICFSIAVLFFSVTGKVEQAITLRTIFLPISFLSAIASAAGVGGGGLFTAYFTYMKQPLIKSIALCTTLIVPMSLTTVLYTLLGNSEVNTTFGFIYIPAFLGMALPAIVCAGIGVRLRPYVPQRILQYILSFMLFATGLNIIYQALK